MNTKYHEQLSINDEELSQLIKDTQWLDKDVRFIELISRFYKANRDANLAYRLWKKDTSNLNLEITLGNAQKQQQTAWSELYNFVTQVIDKHYLIKSINQKRAVTSAIS
jgi:hypothetical protein